MSTSKQQKDRRIQQRINLHTLTVGRLEKECYSLEQLDVLTPRQQHRLEATRLGIVISRGDLAKAYLVKLGDYDE